MSLWRDGMGDGRWEMGDCMFGWGDGNAVCDEAKELLCWGGRGIFILLFWLWIVGIV